MVLAASRDSHPDEFACLLRADGDTITELLLVPGTMSNQKSAILRLHMMPIDFSVVGSAHSHPTPNFMPSDEDIRFFSQSGAVHLIIAYPYSEGSWNAYSRNGEEIELNVV
ncbi:MAG: Mov34/MPN/PAD-1 family protein [Thermoplasmata archaeon]